MHQMSTPAAASNTRVGLSICAGRVDTLLRSRVCQALAVALTLLLIAALHAQNDGLWFQGDAPRHGANGLFWWDLLSAMPTDPMTFTVRYYARYPVIAPATYPPLFYVLEGFVFSVLGPSPHAAKLLVLSFAGIAGLYTMAWARRWIGPGAGWAGAFLAFIPGVVVWSNAVMLNMPATALGIACLYHFRRWFEAPDKKHLVHTLVSFTALLLTYYQGASVVCVGLAWIVFLRRHSQLRSLRLPYVVIAGAIAIVPLALAVYFAPVQMARHLPSVASLGRAGTWTYYWKILPEMVGPVALALGMISVAYGLLVPRWRTEVGYLVTWIGALLAGFTLLPAKDPRYILLVAPAFVLAVAIGVASVVRHLPAIRPEWRAAMLAASLALGFWSATRVHMPRVSGFREVAEYLRQHGPTDAVLYDGDYDGLFGFFARAFDPQFSRRIVRADKLLYEYGPTTTFRRVETPRVSNDDDVLKAVRSQCGCRWIVVEMGPASALRVSQRLLREAMTRSEFELAGSFPITGARVNRVDVYKVLGPVASVISVDLAFPAFSNRTFHGVVPITR
jgi:hypothetical protein